MNAVIIEDETLIAKELVNKIAKVAPDIKILEKIPSIKKAKSWFMENPEPDLIFADIQLSDGVSFKIFETFQFQCPIIFTTAYDEYAMQAFKVNGIDYLLKPIKLEELQRAIEKCRPRLAKPFVQNDSLQDLLRVMQSPNLQEKLYKEKFMVGTRLTMRPISVNEIACFVKESIIFLYTFHGEKYSTDFSTLDEIEEVLNPSHYFRANRQCLVHINAIESLKYIENYKIILSLIPVLKMTQDISREKAPGFKKWFDR